MNTIPLLTIAIPTYNGANTICNMLDLLLPQIDDRVELIISDNCSTDNTSDILDSYSKKYSFIKRIINESNIGADGNFLQCMKKASGQYTYLLSDDDILMENSLKNILDFLQSNPPMGLVYLGTADFRNKYVCREKCTVTSAYSAENICTTDKKLFMEYAKSYWGFVSSFIISTERFRQIKNPEKYFGTYWLQSYIHILCSAGNDTQLGVVAGLSVGAGVYMQQSNFDTAEVDGVNYKLMLDFAVAQGFDKIQLEKWYIKRLCLLASHGIVKEKATGNKKINKRTLFKCTCKYPIAWIKVYPILLVPSFVCKMALGIKRKRYGSSFKTGTNRQGDCGTKKEL